MSDQGTTDRSGYTAEEIRNKIDAGFPKFSGTHYPNEDEREALPAVIAGSASRSSSLG